MPRVRMILLAVPLALAAVTAPAASAALPELSLRSPERIEDGPKSDARMEIRRGSRALHRMRVGIELRGTSSARFAKKSYSFEVRGRRGKKGRDVALLGMPAESDWVLGSAHADQTLMRNVVAYETARSMGSYAPRTRFVELTLDGRYQGVYVLTERPKLGERRVNVDKAGISGGYMLELSDAPEEGTFRGPVTMQHYGHYHPRRDKLSQGEEVWIERYVGDTERALHGLGGDWRTLLDERAAVDYLLVQELLKNQDAFARSTFLSKGTDAPLRLGPIWDLDRAMGDSHAGDRAVPQGWITTAGRPLSPRLLADPAFTSRLAARWSAVRTTVLPRMLAAVDRSAHALRGAHVRNARRWPSTRTPGHEAEVARLRSWLTARVAWIDANIDTLRTGA